MCICLVTDVAGMNSYWQNEFHHEDASTTCDDAYVTFYHSFVRLTVNALAHSSSVCHLVAGKILQAHIYNHLDSFQGLLVNFEVTKAGDVRSHEVEVFLQPRSAYRVIKPVGLIKRLKHIEVSSRELSKWSLTLLLITSTGSFILPQDLTSRPVSSCPTEHRDRLKICFLML